MEKQGHSDIALDVADLETSPQDMPDFAVGNCLGQALLRKNFLAIHEWLLEAKIGVAQQSCPNAYRDLTHMENL